MEREVSFEELAKELSHLNEREQLAFAEFLYNTNRKTAKNFMDSISVIEIDSQVKDFVK